MSENQILREHDTEGIGALLVGRRIVAAETGSFLPIGEDNDWYEPARGRLTLDDGTQVLVRPNIGGCSCGAGDYELTHLASVDNVITSVRLVDESTGDDKSRDGGRYDENGEYITGAYRIFVVADAVEVNILTVEGDDGNGYYGTGYSLIVQLPEKDRG